MTTKPAKTQRTAVKSAGAGFEPLIPPVMKQFFDFPPLIEGEDGDEYESLFNAVVLEIAPTNIFEWLWAKDIVELVWEAKWLRYMKARVIAAAQRAALRDLLETLLRSNPDPEYKDSSKISFERRVETLAFQWQSGGPQAPEVAQLLKKHGVDPEMLLAEGVAKEIEVPRRLVERCARCLQHGRRMPLEFRNHHVGSEQEVPSVIM